MASAQRGATHVPPYAADGRADYYGMRTPEFTDPAFADEPGGNRQYVSDMGWAPGVSSGDIAGTPDPQRTEETLRVDRRANLRNPWAWWQHFRADQDKRESVVEQDADGWTELKGSRSRAADPRWIPVPESRPTQQMAPRNYLFSRPFDQDVARRFTGAHMSLANNRRNYEILTMAPATQWRNTYRTEPTPWDTDIVDDTVTPADNGHPQKRLQSPNIPPSMTTRSYRL